MARFIRTSFIATLVLWGAAFMPGSASAGGAQCSSEARKLEQQLARDLYNRYQPLLIRVQSKMAEVMDAYNKALRVVGQRSYKEYSADFRGDDIILLVELKQQLNRTGLIGCDEKFPENYTRRIFLDCRARDDLYKVNFTLQFTSEVDFRIYTAAGGGRDIYGKEKHIKFSATVNSVKKSDDAAHLHFFELRALASDRIVQKFTELAFHDNAIDSESIESTGGLFAFFSTSRTNSNDFRFRFDAVSRPSTIYVEDDGVDAVTEYRRLFRHYVVEKLPQECDKTQGSDINPKTLDDVFAWVENDNKLKQAVSER